MRIIKLDHVNLFVDITTPTDLILTIQLYVVLQNVHQILSIMLMILIKSVSMYVLIIQIPKLILIILREYANLFVIYQHFILPTIHWVVA